MNKKGISLIVLVITIIVMIILAASVVLTLNNTSVINKANAAVNTTNAKEVEQYVQLLWSEAYIEGEGKWTAEEIQEYMDDKLSDEIKSNYIIVATNKGVTIRTPETLKIGDVVKYTGAVSGTYETTMLETAKTYTTTIEEQEQITWIYIGKDESGNHLITTKEPILPGGTGFYLEKLDGYQNGVDELNAICKELYGPNQKVARNMTIEDVNRILEYTGEKGSYMSDSTYYTLETGTKDGSRSDYYIIDPDIEEDIAVITTDISRRNVIWTSDEEPYWLASTAEQWRYGTHVSQPDLRMEFNASTYTKKNIRCIIDNKVSGKFLACSKGSYCYGKGILAIRPVVSIFDK